MIDSGQWVAGRHVLDAYHSASRQRRRTASWLAEALARGEKVLYKRHAARPGVPDDLPGFARDFTDSGQVEVVPARRLRAESGGDRRGLRQWHEDAVARARREGYPGLAMTADWPAMREIAPDPAVLLGHEEDLEELTGACDVRSLCRYDAAREDERLISRVIEVHRHRLPDVLWSAERYRTTLVLRGEVDTPDAAALADRLAEEAALGLRTIGLGGVSFLSAAGVTALESAARRVREVGGRLRLTDVPDEVRDALRAVRFAERTGAEVAEERPVPAVPGQWWELAGRMTDLTRTLLDAPTVADALRRVTEAAVAVIPAADVVSVTLRDPDGSFHTPAHSDPLAVELDRLQYDIGEGPCLTATRIPGPAVARTGDLAGEAAWPHFGPSAARRGLRSSLATALLPHARHPRLTGALNLFSKSHDAFDDAACDRALLLATHASLALAGVRTAEEAGHRTAQLREALSTREVIGQAQGILMQRRGITGADAFDVLRRASNDLNVKLVDIARALARDPHGIDLPHYDG